MTGVTERDADAGVTFKAFAEILGKSRPYVSKLVQLGIIRPPALTAERKIIVDLARQQIAESADPDRSPGHQTAHARGGTYATERARLVALQAERAALELAVRKGEVVERRLVAEAIGPELRKLRDTLINLPLDVLPDAEQAAAMAEAIEAALERASVEIMKDGGLLQR